MREKLLLLLLLHGQAWVSGLGGMVWVGWCGWVNGCACVRACVSFMKLFQTLEISSRGGHRRTYRTGTCGPLPPLRLDLL